MEEVNKVKNIKIIFKDKSLVQTDNALYLRNHKTRISTKVFDGEIVDFCPLIKKNSVIILDTKFNHHLINLTYPLPVEIINKKLKNTEINKNSKLYFDKKNIWLTTNSTVYKIEYSENRNDLIFDKQYITKSKINKLMFWNQKILTITNSQIFVLNEQNFETLIDSGF